MEQSDRLLHECVVDGKDINALLEGLIMDEGKIVTYKWLAFTTNIPFKHAQKCLVDFVSTHEVTAYYSVVGRKDGAMIIKVVPGDKKDDVIKQFNGENENDHGDITQTNDDHKKVCVGIYSVQQKALKSVHQLYTVDYELCRRLRYEHRSLYSIRNDEVVLNGVVEDKVGEGKSRQGEEDENYTRLVGKTEALAVKAEVKEENTMMDEDVQIFNNKDSNKNCSTNKNDNIESKRATNSKKVVEKSKKVTTGSNKIENLFGNHKKVPKKMESAGERGVNGKCKANNEKNKVVKTMKENKKSAKEGGNTSHRKRVLVESSSEGEEDGHDNDINIFSDDDFQSPSKTKVEEKVDEEDDSTSTVKHTKENNNGLSKAPKKSPPRHSVMKKRVVEMSTYMDKDGFMVTERVVQSVEVAKEGGDGAVDDDGVGGDDFGIGDDGRVGDEHKDEKKNSEKVRVKESCIEKDKDDRLHNNDKNIKKDNLNSKKNKEENERKKKSSDGKSTKAIKKTSSGKQASMMTFFTKK